MYAKVYIVLFCFYIIAGITDAIDTDYLGLLRSHDCTSKHAEQDCQSYCKGVPALCHEGECYCHRSIGAVSDTKSPVRSEEFEEDRPETILTSYGLRPSLRHQIAHFCPNLNKARECVRKCIGTGKPAFCGKDHACYCGHSYSNHDSQLEQDAVKTYKEFKDMYAKYLGGSYNEKNISGETSFEKLDDKK